MFGPYSVIYWNKSGEAEEVGFINFYPFLQFFINSSKIEWHSNGEVSLAFKIKH